MSTVMARLIRAIETAPDFGYDDESVELTECCDRRGWRWFFGPGFYNPKVVVIDAAGKVML